MNGRSEFFLPEDTFYRERGRPPAAPLNLKSYLSVSHLALQRKFQKNGRGLSSINISLFIFGPLSWLVMLGIAAFTSFLATFLPVRSSAKRKPIESIRAL